MSTTRTSYLIGRADRMVRAQLERRLDKGPVSLNQFAVLSALTTRPGLSNAELARQSLVSPQAMHKVVRTLEDSGLIRRGPSSAGGRSLEATITAKGKAATSKAETPIAEAIEAFLEPLEADERVELRRLLTKLGRFDAGS